MRPELVCMSQIKAHYTLGHFIITIFFTTASFEFHGKVFITTLFDFFMKRFVKTYRILIIF